MDTVKADRLVLIKKRQASIDERERISRRLKSLRKEIYSFIGPVIEHRISNCDEDIKYIILHMGNAAALAEEIAVLQLNKRNISVMLLSRDLFEECSVISKLIDEHKDSRHSEFFRYLLVKDMNEDNIIQKQTGHENFGYYMRFNMLLSKYFSKDLKRFDIPAYDPERTFYSFSEKKIFAKAVRSLINKYKNRYITAKLCCSFLEENSLLTMRDKQDAKHIYTLLCHCSGLNFSALEDMCYMECDGTKLVSFNNNHENLTSVMQWVYYSLSYTFEKVVKFI
ncbi:MAG: hypothetical protein Q4F95_07555 [Oscillospiraceae bacterium]|nr:hypothetical protein [Oscillospiraceae bacterium]